MTPGQDILSAADRPGNARRFRVGSWTADPELNEISRGDQSLTLEPKVMRLLVYLAERPGQTVSRRELLDALWGGVAVVEEALTRCVSQLRRSLDDDPREPRYIQTVSKRGYRLVAPVVGDESRRFEHRESVPGLAAHEPTLTVVPAPARLGPGHRIRSRSMWIPVLIVPFILVLVAYVVLFRASPKPPQNGTEMIATPLTAYQGHETVPSLSADGSQVTFSWNGPKQDNYDIYVKLVGPGEALRLTTDPARDEKPAWSPDGQRIAFLRFSDETSADVFVVPALGGSERRVSTIVVGLSSVRVRPMTSLAWTTDGKWLAVGGQASPTDPSAIWLLEADGQERRRLTEVPEQGGGAISYASPAFSPDGRRIAFLRETTAANSEMYVLPLSGDLRPAGRPVRVAGDARWGIIGLAWTPDGERVVFSSGGPFGQSRLYQVALPSEGPDPRDRSELLPFGEQATAISIARTGRLVYSTEFRDTKFWRLNLAQPRIGPEDPGLAGSTFDEHTPDYSPDGTRLAFASTRSGAEEIWISNADGSSPRQMTFMGGPQCSNPQWSSDGQTILFNSRREGSADLYLLRLATGELRRLTTDPVEEIEPRWSRDGQWIYFATNKSGRYEIWKMPAAGGAAIQVTRGGGLAASESPDGRFLYYAKHARSPTAIWRVPVSGGEETLVTDGLSYSINFVVADRGLYFVAVGDARFKTSIDLFEYDTGRRTTLAAVGKPWWYGVALSRDKQWLLYPTIENAGSNLMLVDRVH